MNNTDNSLGKTFILDDVIDYIGKLTYVQDSNIQEFSTLTTLDPQKNDYIIKLTLRPKGILINAVIRRKIFFTYLPLFSNSGEITYKIRFGEIENISISENNANYRLAFVLKDQSDYDKRSNESNVVYSSNNQKTLLFDFISTQLSELLEFIKKVHREKVVVSIRENIIYNDSLLLNDDSFTIHSKKIYIETYKSKNRNCFKNILPALAQIEEDHKGNFKGTFINFGIELDTSPALDSTSLSMGYYIKNRERIKSIKMSVSKEKAIPVIRVKRSFSINNISKLFTFFFELDEKLINPIQLIADYKPSFKENVTDVLDSFKQTLKDGYFFLIKLVKPIPRPYKKERNDKNDKNDKRKGDKKR